MNMIEVLAERVKSTPEKAAFIFRGDIVAFNQLQREVSRLAGGLSGLGVKKGDAVAIYLGNSPEYVYSYLAVWCLGATAVPFDFMLTEDELVSCLTHCEAKVLIARQKANLNLSGIKNKCPQLKSIITCHEQIEGCLSFNELLGNSKAHAPAVAVSDKDRAIIFYTSGTTGKPKGVLVNYRQLGAPPQSMDFFVGGIKPGDTAVCALPFSHLGGLIYIQNCVAHGLTFVLMERFIPIEFLKCVQAFKATCFWIVPSMYYAFLQLKEFETFDLSSLRWVVTFGASSSADALRRFHQFCPKAQLLNGWGLTETNAPTTVLPMGSEKIESVGRPAPWIEVKVFSAAGASASGETVKELAQGQAGEVAVKGWVVTDGYFKDEALTRQVIRNGWFFSGDLGNFDAEGNLYIVGRIKEMIKVGGEIVFEPEVENVIHKHPDVAEAAVVGVADKLRGEVPKAYICLKQDKNLSEEDLRFFLRKHLAHFKIPHYFEFLPALPKNRVGKIDKELLRTLHR